MTFLPDADRVTPPESADAERLMRGLANAVPGIMVYLDATLRCGFANRADLEWVGRSAETVVNRSVEEIFGHACAHSVRSPFDAGLRGEPGMIERSTPRPGGRWLVHQIRCIPDRKPSGQIAAVDVMAFEITRLKEAESALRATNATLLRSRNEAQAATVATAAFLANMRHEIRTPMNAVIGPTHVILRSSHDTWQRERLAKIDTEMGTGRPQDVMLVDGRTAPLNGIEALQRLRDLLGNGMPPHAIVTAFNDEHFLAQTRSAEIDTVLVKPITASSLLDGLVRCLGTGAPGPAASPMDVCEAEQRRRRLHAGQRLLLAEDNPINQAVALELLRWCDLLVDVAGNGAQAVELAVAPPYDLALMDMQMPRLDGLEATRSIRQRIGHQLPIFAMTVNAFNEDRDACLAAGMNDHLAKPIDPERLPGVAALAARTAATPGSRHDRQRRRRPAVAGRAPDRRRGLDMAFGLRSIGGRLDDYGHVLGVFVATYADGAPAPAPARHATAAEACRPVRSATRYAVLALPSARCA